MATTHTPEARPTNTDPETWEDVTGLTWNDFSGVTWESFALGTVLESEVRPSTSHTAEARP